MRDWSGLLWAVVAGSVLTWAVFHLNWAEDASNDCVIVAQIFDKPANALLGVPRNDPASPRAMFSFDAGCEYSTDLPGVLKVWITFWLPLLLAWFAAGYLAARWVASVSLVRCAIAGAAVALPRFGLALATEFRLQEFFGSTGQHHLEPVTALTVLAALGITAASFGGTGGQFGDG